MASKVIADMQKMIDKYGDKPFLLEFDLKNEKGEVKLAKICSIGIGRFDTNDEQFYYISNIDIMTYLSHDHYIVIFGPSIPRRVPRHRA